MKIVIDIPKNLYKANINGLNAEEIWDLRVAIKNGAPLKALEQEPCEDAISREDVDNALYEYWHDINIVDDSGYFIYKDSMDIINKLPSVYPKAKEQKWIPVSERLPEQFRFVNCTCHSLIDDREDWVVETVYIPQLPNSPYSDWGNIPMLNWKQAEVVAWMYRDIPEPYKAESEDNE